MRLFLISFTLFSISCKTPVESNTKEINGIVRFIDLEGGFYGIVSNDNKHYKPINLDPEYQHDGLQVVIKAKKEEAADIFMWGTMIRIIAINTDK